MPRIRFSIYFQISVQYGIDHNTACIKQVLHGRFYGKARYTGKMHYAVIGFVLSWIFHGAYDFGLCEEFLALGESAAFLSVGLALLSLVFVIIMIVFFARKNKKQQYLEPLPQPANE